MSVAEAQESGTPRRRGWAKLALVIVAVWFLISFATSAVSDARTALGDFAAGRYLEALLGFRGAVLILGLAGCVCAAIGFARKSGRQGEAMQSGVAPTPGVPVPTMFRQDRCLAAVWLIAMSAIALWSLLKLCSTAIEWPEVSGVEAGFALVVLCFITSTIAGALFFQSSGLTLGSIIVDARGLSLHSVGTVTIPWSEVREITIVRGNDAGRLHVYPHEHQRLLDTLPAVWRWWFRHRAKSSPGFAFLVVPIVALVPPRSAFIAAIEHFKPSAIPPIRIEQGLPSGD